MEVINAVYLVRGIHSERSAIEILAADNTIETYWVIRFACSSQHLKLNNLVTLYTVIYTFLNHHAL